MRRRFAQKLQDMHKYRWKACENYEKCTVLIHFVDKTVKSFVFYDTLETEELKELARLIKCTIAPCEVYPDWLEANELYLDQKTLDYIEKIKKGEI